MKTKMTFDELVEREARSLARGLLEDSLRKQDLPLPKDSSLEIHIDALLTTRGDGLRTQAKDRVLACQDAYSDSLRVLGIEPSAPAQPIDLDLGI